MLFAEKKLAQSGSAIQQMIQQADQDPNKQSAISSLLEKHFGSVSAPNPDLVPNVPASERTGVMKLIKSEIMQQGQGELGSTTFQDLQGFKQGAQQKGSYDKSISSGKQQLYQNIARKYGDVLKEGIPGIAQQYQQYGAAKQAIATHGKGIVNELSHKFNQMPFVAKYLISRQVQDMLTNVKVNAAPTYKQGQQNPLGVQGFQGYGQQPT